MSILIKGMKMPQSCLLCPFGDEFGKCCVNAELEDADELTHSCPLVELPDHGDLIDRDEAADDACFIWCRNSAGDDAVQEIIEHLRKIKAVISAERSEE